MNFDLSLNDFKDTKAIAIAVSGGPDSLALVHIVSQWSHQNNGPDIHAITVDHGLRPEARAEAEQAGDILKNWPKTTHQILTWESKKPDTAIQEKARHARYELMAEYCAAHDIAYLFLAHHRDDQAETFLFRLAKGSGLDGLACMAERQSYSDHLTLVRPLLHVSKHELAAYCREHGLDFIDDPSNQNDDFARIRLRKSAAVLEEEGLSAKRLSTTAARLRRAREALEFYTDKAFERATITERAITFEWDMFSGLPADIQYRLLQKCYDFLGAQTNYGPRTERLEDVLFAIRDNNKIKRTLGGLEFVKTGTSLIIGKE